NNFDPKQVLEFAAIAAFEKLFIESDTTNIAAEKLLLKLNNWPG
ncbi:MAG: hypothetical protein JWQ57_1077, partial [Mucilaginibacter sp.]|nr:hypothetical protein [Mucilaginibacter sp.]MDB5147057.1 hypothetical protein [Mucilaginibacter sp.]